MEPVNPYASPMAVSGDVIGKPAEYPLTLFSALFVGTSLYIRRFPTLAAISLAIWIPLELFISYQEYFVLDPDDPLGALRWSLLADGLIGIIAVGGAIHVAEAELRDEHRGWLVGLGAGLRGWPYLFSSRLVGGLLLVLAALAFLLPALYLSVRYSLSDTAAIIERRAGMKAISRSLELTRGRFLVFLGLCIVTILPLLAAGAAIFVPLAFFPQFDHWLLSAALTCVIDLFEPWMTVVFVAAYVQCRAEQRREQPAAQTVSAPSGGPA